MLYNYSTEKHLGLQQKIFEENFFLTEILQIQREISENIKLQRYRKCKESYVRVDTKLRKCAETMRNRYTGIINSFSTTITNGFT